MERYGSSRKRLVGSVVGDKMDKTVVVSVERLVRHPRYGKVLRRVKKYKVHDERNACRVGDIVRIVESRPLSREKRWTVEEIVKRVGAEEALEVGQ
jgi:small subunit ribosomal protein S17